MCFLVGISQLLSPYYLYLQLFLIDPVLFSPQSFTISSNLPAVTLFFDTLSHLCDSATFSFRQPSSPLSTGPSLSSILFIHLSFWWPNLCQVRITCKRRLHLEIHANRQF